MRIFLACEDERLKISMLLLVDSQPGMVVSGISDRIDNIAQQLETSQPDVLVLGWELPMESMHDLMDDIHNLDSSPEVIFLSSSPKEREAIMSAGVDYFVVTNAPPDELIQILNDLRRSKKENRPLSTR
jgi:DNA-binding NarL/FixJ family response regulator